MISGIAYHPWQSICVALYVVENSLTMADGRQIATSALSARLPSAFGARDQVQAGGLTSYGPKYTDLFRRAAEIVDKILLGAKAGDIPVEEPTNFDLVLNLTTAKALGLAVAPTLLATADEVIECSDNGRLPLNRLGDACCCDRRGRNSNCSAYQRRCAKRESREIS
jgi:hypothetical protein